MLERTAWGHERERWRTALTACEQWIGGPNVLGDPLRWSTAAEASFRRKCFSELALNVLLAEAMGWRAANEPTGPLASIRAYLIERVDDRLVDLAHRSRTRLPAGAAARLRMLGGTPPSR